MSAEEKNVDEELGGLDEDEDEMLTLISCDEDNPAKFEISKKSSLAIRAIENASCGSALSKEEQHPSPPSAADAKCSLSGFRVVNGFPIPLGKLSHGLKIPISMRMIADET